MTLRRAKWQGYRKETTSNSVRTHSIQVRVLRHLAEPSTLLIEIHGAQLRNKGALKMLLSAMARLERGVPHCRIAVDGVTGSADLLKGQGLTLLRGSRGWMGRRLFSVKFMLQRAISRVPLMTESVPLHSIDALLDVSGFAYSDEWGHQPSSDFARLASYYSRRGKPVIMLPQAFGPFVSRESRRAFSKIMDNVSIAYARDTKSYEHAIEFVSEPSKLRIAPDITLFERQVTQEPDPQTGLPIDVVLVPNIQVTRRGNSWPTQRYIDTLIYIARLVINMGLNVNVLVHDNSGLDADIAKSVASNVSSSKLVVIEAPDPWELKNIIASSRLVIASRYHALVAALSNSVPVISLGWSHKYESLLEEFDQRKYCISRGSNRSSISELIHGLCSDEENVEVRNTITENLRMIQPKSDKMWADVYGVLLGKTP